MAGAADGADGYPESSDAVTAPPPAPTVPRNDPPLPPAPTAPPRAIAPEEELLLACQHLTPEQVKALVRAAVSLWEDPASAQALCLVWEIQKLSRTDQQRLLAILRVFGADLKRA